MNKGVDQMTRSVAGEGLDLLKSGKQATNPGFVSANSGFGQQIPICTCPLPLSMLRIYHETNFLYLQTLTDLLWWVSVLPFSCCS